MNASDYTLEASLFYAKSPRSKHKALTFRRFDKAADAIRFAVEELAPKLLEGCSLEINETHYFGREIRPLYDDVAFPLRRCEKKAVAARKLGKTKTSPVSA